MVATGNCKAKHVLLCSKDVTLVSLQQNWGNITPAALKEVADTYSLNVCRGIHAS